MPARKNLADKEKTMGTIKNKIFILHGWTYSTEKWDKFLDLIGEKDINPRMLYVPGLTGKLNAERVWNLDDYIDWLKQILDKEKGKVILIGHSNGGRIALNFAIKYPQKVSSLILINSAGIYHNELYIRIKRLFFATLARIGKKITSSEKLRSLLYKMTGERDYKNASPFMRKTMINLMKSDMSLSLDKINVPTLIMWGEHDKILPLKDGKKMHTLIKNSTLKIIKGARHSPQFTHAREVADIIYEYF